MRGDHDRDLPVPGFDELTPGGRAQAFYLVALLGIVMAGILATRSVGFFRMVGMLATWLAIIAGTTLVLGDGEWVERFQARTALRVDPAAPGARGAEVRIRAHPDGHFWVRALVNGQSVLFLVDTGASDVVLTSETARRVGIPVAQLAFDRRALTANGMVRGAAISLRELSIGPIARHDVGASVTEGALQINLLGMGFLRSLAGWRVEGDTLILLS